MTTLYEIGDDLIALENLLLASDGDITDEQAEAAIDKWLAESREAQEQKIDAYCAWIKDIEARAKSRRAEVARLEASARALENRSTQLKRRLLEHLDRTSQTRIMTPRFRVAKQRNGGLPPVVHLAPFEKWPVQWVEIETVFKPKTDAVRAALEAGQQLEFAKLGERGFRLDIR